MTINSSNNNKISGVEIHKNELLNHIDLPTIHPNPLQSIEIQQKIYDLVRSKENIFDVFEGIFNSLETQEQYFFLNYGLEYLYPNTYYPNYLQMYFVELTNKADENATVLRETSSERIILNDSSLYEHLDEELDKTEQSELIIEFIREQLPLITYKLKLHYRDILQGQGYTFASEHFAIDNYKLDPKLYQITIPQYVEEFLHAVRKSLSSKIDIEQIDAFLYNSFNFTSNYTSMEILTLNFGNSELTNTLIHKVYSLYKSIVKKKTSRFDFAKVMYVNFEFVRDNWITYNTEYPEVIREEYLKKRVASNIEK